MLFAIVAFHAVAFAQEQLASPTVAPNVELWRQDACTVEFDGHFFRDVTCQMWDKHVLFEWRATTGELPSSTNVRAITSQSFSTAYWPNVVRPTDRYELCVAGRDASGNTILERWTFANRTEDGNTAPSLGTAPGKWVWSLPRRTRVDSVLRIPMASPHGMIRGMIRSFKTKDQVYVYFNTSREVAIVDLNSHVITTIASPTGASGSFTVPDLTKNYWVFWASDYRERGYCYFFKDPMVISHGPTPAPTLALIDSNRDGAIDKTISISGAQWDCDGWGDAKNVVGADWER